MGRLAIDLGTSTSLSDSGEFQGVAKGKIYQANIQNGENQIFKNVASDDDGNSFWFTL